MSSQSGFSGIFCPACDQSGTPSQLVRSNQAGARAVMALKCPVCGRTYSYAALMDSNNPHPPRKAKIEFTEKPPAGTQLVTLWLHPDAVVAWHRKFPANPITTMSSAITALVDPDSVLIEGQYAREMASIGIKTGKEVLGMAKEVKELRDEVASLRLREQTLRQFFGSLGMAMPQPLAQQPSSPSTDITTPPVDEYGNPLTPPRADFIPLVEVGGEPEVTSQFSFPTGAAPTADARPGFITRNLR